MAVAITRDRQVQPGPVGGVSHPACRRWPWPAAGSTPVESSPWSTAEPRNPSKIR